jgi:hypothetical protein
MGSGGSRYGAGRPATHVKAEHCRRIDVRRWQREGILQPGQAGAWQWSDPDTGERTAAIGYRSNGGSVTLDYAIDGEPRKQLIRLDATACHYGGARQWFTCPVRGERVAVLFLRAGRFACRHCQRIAYGSQSGDLCDRTWRKQAKAEAKLGPNWTRPKGMHQATRERLMAIIWRCEERRETALASYIESMMRRCPGLQGDRMLSRR